jgi:hypothetical protein
VDRTAPRDDGSVNDWKRLVWTKLLVFSVSSAGMLALAVTKAGGSVGYA